MVVETIFGQLLKPCSGSAIVGIGIDTYAAAWRKEARYLDIFRVHELDKVFHDDVYTVFMKIAVVSEAEEIEFEALALHHLHIGHIADAYLGKVGLPRDRAQ